ncbi:MAG: HNH endonuclease signature motif containing protein [Chloroflexota bacterium]|nr:HNH endonuclease signature motif containing protein [Chloroflexota bacterium]
MTTQRHRVSITPEQRAKLEPLLLNRQSGKCYICDEPIDLELQHEDLEIDHIDPFSQGGADSANNYALVHQRCNRSKGASDIRVARRLAEMEKLHQQAKAEGERGANLRHVLTKYGGGKARLRVRRESDRVEFSFSETADPRVQSVPLYRDKLSGAEYFFTVAPLEYLHHDDRINPRDIGANVRNLIEEFLQGRPQLHIGLAWWAAEEDGAGTLKLFDGQHKAASQIMLGVKELPVRVFMEPDVDVLVTTNTNAGSSLRQIAFDKATMRHLGSTLYADRAAQYRKMRQLPDDDLSFSEQDLVRHFRGEHRQMEKYIIDAQRDFITHNPDNRLTEFVEMGGRGTSRPLAYATVERAFFQLLHQKALNSAIDEGLESGSNPRDLERTQMIRLMNIFADVFFVDKWDPDVGGYQLESRIFKGDEIAEQHLRAWRIARDEVAVNVIRWVKLVITHYFAFTGKMVDDERLLHARLPDALWERIAAFFENLSALPCWVDKNMAQSVFGPKQNFDYWNQVFQTGESTDGTKVLAEGLSIQEMISSRP